VIEIRNLERNSFHLEDMAVGTYFEEFAAGLAQLERLYKLGSVLKDWLLLVGDGGHGKATTSRLE
jgi:hypothetical protein